MEWLLSHTDESLEGLSKWLNSIVVHTYNPRAAPPTMSPILFVGTHKDVVSSAIDHEQISTMLYDNFSHSIAWPFRLINETFKGQRGTTTLNFFPVSCVLGRADSVVGDVMTTIEGALDKMEHIRAKKPASWLRCLDALVEQKRSDMTYDEVREVARRNSLPEVQVPQFLRFLHKVGGWTGFSWALAN